MSSFDPRGVWTAVVTPFAPDGAVDWRAYEALVQAQVDAGVAGVIAAGSTGESVTLTKAEKYQLIATAVSVAGGRCGVVAGTGSNSTADAVEATSAAKAAGVDACMLVNPYYNRPTQAGLIAHVKAVASVGLPIVLYNNVGRSAVNMLPATVAELRSTVPEVVAIKEASGSVDQVSEIIAACDLPVLSGDDGLTVPVMAIGAVGVMSVISNLVPRRIVEMVALAAAGDYAGAARIHTALYPLHRALYVETNPVPVKRALQLLGAIPSAAVRLPLVELTPQSDAVLRAAVAAVGLLNAPGALA